MCVVIETELVIGAHLFQRALLPSPEEEIHLKTLPKALRTQALTSLTSNFGLVGLAWFDRFSLEGLVWYVWVDRFGLVSFVW